MVIRQALPFALGAEGRRPPSHLTLAVGLSIGAHVAVGLYVAFLKFTGPPPVIYPPDRIYEVPLVDELPPPPPPEQPKDPPQRPVIHESIPAPLPPIPPLDIAPQRDLTTAPVGPVANLDMAPQVVSPPPPRDPIIRNPTWVRRPDAGDFARFYPERALRLGREGEAEITCQVLASGQVSGCRVTGEAPDNMGFGAAALKLSRYLQIAPKTVDGKPVDGGTLVVPITFRLG